MSHTTITARDEHNASRVTVNGRRTTAKHAARLASGALPREYDGSKYGAPTKRMALVSQRTGQGPFRTALIERDGRCLITGETRLKWLIAAHIKPHCLCEDGEYFDLSNGILLRADVHVAFDLPLFTILPTGLLLTVPSVRMLIERDLIVRVTPGQQEYLLGHNKWFRSFSALHGCNT